MADFKNNLHPQKSQPLGGKGALHDIDHITHGHMVGIQTKYGASTKYPVHLKLWNNCGNESFTFCNFPFNTFTIHILIMYLFLDISSAESSHSVFFITVINLFSYTASDLILL